jgi:hypothetical protein
MELMTGVLEVNTELLATQQKMTTNLRQLQVWNTELASGLLLNNNCSHR